MAVGPRSRSRATQPGKAKKLEKPRPWYFIPIINVLYDILLDTSPTMAQINECMATIGLIAGLMVTVAQAVMNSEAAEYKDTDYGGRFTDFQLYSVAGFAFLTAAMLTVVVHYLGTSCSDLEGLHPQGFKSWWLFMRCNLVIACGCTIGGLSSVMRATFDLFILQNCDSDKEAEDMWSEVETVYGKVIITGIGVLLPWCFMSMALANAKRVEGRLEIVALKPDFVKDQLKKYTDSLDDIFYAEEEDFLAFLENSSESLGQRQEMSKMSREFAVLAFGTWKEETLQFLIRSQTPEQALV